MTTYRPAPAVERIAAELIPKHHDHLDGVRIEYVFRDTASKSAGKLVWGKARKVSGLNAYLATETTSDVVDVEDFFVIEIAEDVWASLDESQRVALVDHELMHCLVSYDDYGERASLTVRPHDVEEFRAIVERHGFWSADVVNFADAVSERWQEMVDQGLV